MNPITREEQYLNRLTGEEGIIPDKPVTREEQYFARLCGGDNVIPDKPVTRREQYLATLCGEDVITPTKPVTRIEQYMAFASGESESKPEKPITREEMYWDKYQGGDVPEEKTIAFTNIITVTDALARPAVDLQSEITATQNLNGYEYPWVGGAGKNKVESIQSLNIGSNGELVSLTGYKSPIAKVENGKTYIFSINGVITVPQTYAFYSSYPTVGSVSYNGTRIIPQAYTFTAPIDGYIVARYSDSVDDKIQIELGSTATAYAPYENICPISGRTEVNVTRTGKNILYKKDTEHVLGYTKPQMSFMNGTGTTLLFYGVAGKTYTYNRPSTANRNVLAYFGTSEPTVGSLSVSWANVDTTFTVQSPGYYVLYIANTALDDDIQIELGSTATAYEPYEGDTFNTELGRTVYGGTLDLTTGELTITHAYEDLYSRDWLYSPRHNVFTKDLANRKSGATNFITTNYRTVDKNDVDELLNGEITGAWSPKSITVKDERATTVADFIALLTDAKICYELATPQTISLTPTEVQMLENNNTIWADSGRVQLTYLSKAAEKVQLMNASLKANTLKISKGAVKK